MTLQKNELDQITAHVSEHVKAHLTEWLSDRSPGQPLVLYEIEMRERIVRVEEELRHQRELMQQGFMQMDKRFEQVDKRFEAVDKRFDALTRRMDRFMIWSFGITVTAAGTVISVLKWWP